MVFNTALSGRGGDTTTDLLSSFQGINNTIGRVNGYGISNFSEAGSGYISGGVSYTSGKNSDAFVASLVNGSLSALTILQRESGINPDDYIFISAIATDVSDNGLTAVGGIKAIGKNSIQHALWWYDLAQAPRVLQTLSGDNQASAVAMDGAGTIAVGSSFNSGGGLPQAVYWNLTVSSPAAVSLSAEFMNNGSWANDISRNGQYIVGGVDLGIKASVPYVYDRNSAAPTMMQIAGPAIEGLMGGGNYIYGEAAAVSDDGRVVGSFYLTTDQINSLAGAAKPYTDEVGFITAPGGGPAMTIHEWLKESGATVEGWAFTSADSISRDGTVVSGQGQTNLTYNKMGYLNTSDYFSYIARAGSGAIDVAEFQQSVATAGGVAPTQVNNALNMTLNGAHHIPLQMMKGPSRHFWVTGDAGRWDNYQTNSYLAEVGGAIDLFDQQLLVGFGVGQNYVNQKLALGGSTNLDGQYYLSELSYKPKALPFIFTLTGALGNWDAHIDRNYLNLGVVDTSSGRPHLNSNALRLSVHWLDAVKVAGFGLTPKVQYSVVDTSVGAYSENGGGFPAFFNKQNHTAHEVRYGLSAAKLFLADKAQLRFRVDAVHRFDQEGAGTSGQTIGLFNFNFPGQRIKQDWVQFGSDFVYSVSERTNLTASVNTATVGQDPVISGSLGVQVKY